MWPMVLDYDKSECRKLLRKYELEAYSSVVTALRAQGDLNIERRKILRDLASILSIPMDRHRSEVRRVLNDERLFTIAYNISGPDVYYEWTIEGKRLIPLLPRVEPQTVFTTLSNTSANVQATKDMALPEPSQTRSYKFKMTDSSLALEGSNSTKKIKLKDFEQEKKPDVKVMDVTPVHSKILPEPSYIESSNLPLNKEYENATKTVETNLDKSKCSNTLSQEKIIPEIKITPEPPASSSLSFAVKTTGTSLFATKSSTTISTKPISSNTTTTTSPSSFSKVILVSSNSLASIQPSSSMKKLASPPSTSNQMNEKQSDQSNYPIVKKDDTSPMKNIEIIQSNNIKNILSSASSQTSSILTTNLSKSIFTKSSGGHQQQYIVLPINSKSVPSISNIKTVSPALSQSTSSKPIEITKTKQTLLNSQKIIYQATSSKEGQKTNFIIMKPKFTYSALNIPNKQNKQTQDQGLVTVGLSKVSTILPSTSEHNNIIKSSTFRICPEVIKDNSSTNEIASNSNLTTTIIKESADFSDEIVNDNNKRD